MSETALLEPKLGQRDFSTIDFELGDSSILVMGIEELVIVYITSYREHIDELTRGLEEREEIEFEGVGLADLKALVDRASEDLRCMMCGKPIGQNVYKYAYYPKNKEDVYKVMRDLKK